MIPIPPSLYVYAGLFVAGLTIGGGGAWKIASWRCDAAKVESVERAIEQMQALEKQNDEIATRFESDKVRIKTEFRTIMGAIDNTPGPTSADCRFPTAWVWAWNAANRGSGATPGKPADGMPYATYPDKRGTEGDVPEPRLGSTGVPRDVRDAQSTGRLGAGWFE